MMKTQNLDLSKTGLTSMHASEMKQVNAGGFRDAVAGLTGVIVSQAAIVVGVATFQPELIYAGAV